MELQPHHAGINVSDMERSIAFYGMLGFRQVSRSAAEPGLEIAFLRLGALKLELFAYERLTPAPVRESTHAIGFRHLALATDDIERDAAELKAAGVVPEEAAVRELPSGVRLLFFDDPDGVEIEILQEA